MNPKLNFLIGSGLAGVVVAVLVFAPPALKDSTAAAVPPQLAQGFSSIVKAVTPAVVNIQVTQGERIRGPRDPRRRDHEGPPGRPGPGPFGGPPPGPFSGPGPFGEPPGEQEEPEPGLPFGGPPRPDMSGGSGVIIDPNGYIVTNNHVVDRASDIKVYLSNPKEHAAKIIGVDPKTDLAIIKVEATNLPYLKWGNYDELQVGDIVLAVGSPFGLSQTVTMGIISALGRGNVGIADYEDFIQTDASINPGNSGGALVNLKGELIGINTAIFSRTGGNEGIGFAVPVSIARMISDSLVKTGKVVRGWLGVGIQEITPDLAKAFKVKEQRGALVSDVNEHGPALKAGVQRGDVIQEINRQAVNNVKEYEAAAGKIKKEENAVLLVNRQGNSIFIVINP